MIRNHQSEAGIKGFYFRENERSSEREWKPGSWTHREVLGVMQRWYQPPQSNSKQSSRESPVDRRLQLFFPHSLRSWRTLDVFPLRPAARGLAGAEMSRALSRNQSQPLVIMLWIINAEYQRAAEQLSDSGLSWSCTQILDIYSPAQLSLFWKSTKLVPNRATARCLFSPTVVNRFNNTRKNHSSTSLLPLSFLIKAIWSSLSHHMLFIRTWWHRSCGVSVWMQSSIRHPAPMWSIDLTVTPVFRTHSWFIS